MKPPVPGQAAFARLNGRIALVACDKPENLPLGGASFEIRCGLYRVSVEGIEVPAVNAILKLTSDKGDNFYVAWIDELTPAGAGVVESLATQKELPVELASPQGEIVGSARTENGLRSLAHKQLGIISQLADAARWDIHRFAAARAYIESQFPTPELLWEMLRGS